MHFLGVIACRRSLLLCRGLAGLALLVSLGLPLSAQSLESPALRAWKYSAAAMVTATALDASSSYGRVELNPAMAGQDGKFGGRAIAIKAGIAFGGVWLESRLLRGHPKLAKPLTIFNYVLAGGYGSAAAFNMRTR
ncbi:MAG: hypothetical protein ABI811_10285 [Acidobacteriota bacterium]